MVKSPVPDGSGTGSHQQKGESMLVGSTSILPTPKEIETVSGRLVLPIEVSVSGSARSVQALRPFLYTLENAGHIVAPIELKNPTDRAFIRVHMTGDIAPHPDHNAEAEAYEIAIDGTGIEVRGSYLGIVCAAQTLRQLLPPEALRPGSRGDIAMPFVQLRDHPYYSWRAVMLDVSRHFFPVTLLRRLVDLAAFHKLNILHLHLTDDQGWRMPIDAFPRLTEIGAVRRETVVGELPSDVFDGVPHGGHYTKGELHDLVTYARDLGVTIIPEIDLPGHMVAAIAAYPQWGNTDEPVEVMTTWGISERIINTRAETIKALETILDEVMEVFDSPYIHLGGDEVPPSEWEDSPEVQELIKAENLPSLRAVQGWIMDQLVEHVEEAGRTVVAWDEAVEANIDKSAVIVGWRSPQAVKAALAAGYRTVAAPQQHFYLDYQHSDSEDEPQGIGRKYGAYTDIDKVLDYLPPEGLIGIEAPLWTEYVSEWRRAEYQYFPRLAAVAERAWNGPRVAKDQFMEDLEEQLRRYHALGVDYRPLDGPGISWKRTFDDN